MKKTLLLLAAVSTGMAVWGNPVDLEKARQLALSHIQTNGTVAKRAKAADITKSVKVSTDAYYVFNVGRNDGFVIVAADDNAPAILGHSSNGTFDENNIPDGMKWWLENCQRYVKYVASHPKAPRKAKYQDLPGLITTKWNQGAPFNSSCPKFDGAGYAATGCVATAAAQILRYHEWPKDNTKLIPGYTSNEQGFSIQLEDLQPKKFNWDAMKDSYTPREEAKEVADLMRYCGQAMEMKYSPRGSGSNVLVASFKEYFNYASTAQEIERSAYTEAEWEKVIYNEIKENRPVLYTGGKFDASMGYNGYHAFVCHGYKAGKFLINWGWGGLSDGEYDLSVLNPAAQGIGSFSGAGGYTTKQAVIVGLTPNKSGQQADNGIYTLFVKNIQNVQEKYQRTDKTQDFVIEKIELTVAPNNYTAQNFKCGWQLRNAANKPVDNVDILGVANIDNMKANNSSNYSCESTALTFGKNLPSGTYYLVPMFAINDDALNVKTWKPFINSSMYIKLDINDTELTATNFTNRSDVQCTELKGETEVEENIAAKVTAKLLNKGISNTVTVYLYDETTTKSKKVDAVEFMIDANQEKEITLLCTPKIVGRNEFVLYADYSAKVRLGSIVINATEAKSANLQPRGNTRVKNANGTIVTDKFDCEVSVMNWGDETYKNKIIAVLSDHNGPVETLSQDVEIEQDKDVKLTFSFSKMQDGGEYCVYVYYINKNLRKSLNYAQPTFYTFHVSDGIENIETIDNANKLVTIYRIDGSVAARVQNGAVQQTLKNMAKGVYIVNGKKYLSY